MKINLLHNLVNFNVFDSCLLRRSQYFLKSNFKEKLSPAKIIRLAAIIVLLFGFLEKSNGQLGSYVFSGAAACPNMNNAVASQPSNALFSDFSNSNAACVSSDSNFAHSDWNTSGVIDLDEYNEFTITPNAGFLITLTSINFDQQVSADNTPFTTWFLRSSLDNFTSDLSSGSATSLLQNETITLPAAFTNVANVTFRFYLVNANGASVIWTNDNVIVNGSVNNIPAIPGNPTSDSPQCSTAGVTLNASGTPPSGETWYWQSSVNGTDLSNSNTSFVVYTSGTYYIRSQNNTSLLWSDGAGSTTITISSDVATPVFASGATSTRCDGAGTETYTASATNNTGITYSLDAASITGGNSINATTGEVTYDASWTGTTTITASAAGCNGPTTASHTVTINNSVGTPVFASGATSTRCEGAGTETYTASATNNTGITYSLDAASITGGNSINATTGEVTYDASWTGTTTITASAAGCNGPTTASHIVTINNSVGTPVFASGATSTRCEGAGTETYTATAANNTGLTYTLDAASITGGNSINATTGEVTYDAGWSGTTTITASAAGCNGPTTVSHIVTVTATVGTPVFALGATSSRCEGAGTEIYTASATNNTGITYSLDAASITGGNSINPTTGIVTYDASWTGTTTITATAAGCNGPTTASHTVTINITVGATIFSLGSTSTRCQGANAVTYTASATNSTGITYTIDAASITGGNSINATTGEVTYDASWSGSTTITVTAAGCSGPKTAVHVVTVTPTVGTPVFALGGTSTRCQGANAVTYTATATNNTGLTYSLDAASITGSNTINAITGEVTYDAGWSGVTTITASAAGCNGPTTASHTVTINPTVGATIFSMGSTSTRCQGANVVTYTATATNNTGITYSLDAASITGGNSINPTTGIVTYDASWTGTTTITASAAGCNGPTTASHTVTITPTVGTPVFAIGATSNRCLGATTINYSATSTLSTGITYSLDAISSAAGNTINAATGEVSYTAIYSGNSTVTASSTGCNGPKNAIHTVSVTPNVGIPVFAMGATSTRCQGAIPVTYTASSTNSTSITYSLDAASISGGNTINPATGEVTYDPLWTGSSVVTATASGCNGPRTNSHTISTTPTVSAPVFLIGSASTQCQIGTTKGYTATATNTTGITYSLDAASLSGGNTIIAATGAVTFSAAWSGTTIITASAAGCNGPVTSTHTVTITPTVGTPVFSAGPSSIRCQGTGTSTYTATASNTTGITYSLSAASAAAGNTIDAVTGEVTWVAGWSGVTTITATASGCNGPKMATHDVTTTASVGTPVFTFGASTTRCQVANTITYTATATTNTGLSYALDPASAGGGVFINSANGTVTYPLSWSGTTIITVTASGCNGPTVNTHTVMTTPIVGTPVFASGNTSTRCQGVETINYTATSTNNTGITYTIDAASNTGGNIINPSTGDVTYASGWSGTTTITAAAAGCSGPKTSTHVVTITPTVGTPVFALGGTTTRCQGANSVTYTATATNNTGITYTLDPVSAGGGNTINPSTGAVTYNAAWTGTSVITATASGCNGPKTATHTVTSTPSIGTPVFVLGPTSTNCTSGLTIVYTATAANAIAITYALDATSLAGGNTINATTGAVTYTATWASTSVITATATGCNGPTSATHTVIPPTVGTPVFAKGATSIRCQAVDTIIYSATAVKNTGITYSLDAASIGAGNTINSATGEVAWVATWKTASTITATASGCGGPKSATHVVTNNGIPNVKASPSTTFVCNGSSVTMNATGGTTYTWKPASGLNTTTGAIVVATPTSDIIYTVTGVNANGCIDSGFVYITVTNITNQAVSVSPATICTGNSTTVTVAGTQSGINYSLRDNSNNMVVNGPIVGTGSAINFNTGVLTANKSFNVVGENMGGSGALMFDGANDFVSFKDAAEHDPANITVECWVKFNAIQPSAVLIMKADPTTWAKGWGLNMNAAGNKFIFFMNGNPNGLVTSATTVALNTWYHVAATFNGTQTNLYVNGVLEATKAYATAFSGTNNKLLFGSQSGTAFPFNGVLDEIQIWKVARTAAQIQSTMNNALTGNETNLNAYYNFENSTGSTKVGDQSLSNKEGTLTNMDVSSVWVTGRSFIQCSIPMSTLATVTVIPNVGVPVFALGATSTRCQGANTVTYNATATNNSGIIYSLDAASLAGSNTINPTTGAVTYDAAWTGISVITATASGCNGPTSANHTVTTTSTVGTPVFTSGPTTTRCQGAANVTYTATATTTTGITYSLDAASLTGGNTIVPATGVVTYAAGWSGTTIITASAAGCNGPKTAIHTVTVTPTVGVPVFAMGASSTRCQGAGIVTYSATATTNTGITYSIDVASTTAGNSVNPATGEVTYVATWSGTTTVTATATGCNGPKVANHLVTVTPTVGMPTFVLGATSTRCQAGATVGYTATATNNSSLTYSLDAASLSGGNTIVAATGAVTYNASWTGTTIITVVAAGCNGPTTSNHTVTITPTVGTPVFALGATSTRCQGAIITNYTAASTNSTGITYSLDAGSITGGNAINPATGDVTWAAGWKGLTTITASAAGCSGPRTGTHDVTTTANVGLPVFTLGATSTSCQGGATVTYTATATNTTGITYSIDPASAGGGNTINPATGAVTYDAGWSGTTVVTASAAGCNGPRTRNHTIAVTPTVGTPVFILGATTTRCQGGATIGYTATATNSTAITYALDATSLSGGTTIVAATGAVTYAAAWTGTTIITATATGCNGPSTSTHTVTITPTVGTPVMAMGATSTRCQGAATITYSATATNTTGLTYTISAASAAAGNTINPATGQVNWVPTWSGLTTITASAAGCSGPKTATHDVTTTATVGTPIFIAGSATTRCQGAGTATYTATATTSTGISYSLDAASLAAGNTINAATALVTYVAGWSGTTIITASASGCNGPVTSNHTVTVTPTVGNPVFALGASSIHCQGANTVTYTASATNSTAITYTLDLISSLAGNTINAATGAVTFTAGWTGTSTVTASATGCNGPRTSTHTITTGFVVATPVFASGATSTRCQGAGTVNYSATATNTTGITYSLDAASIAVGNIINPSTGAVTYDASWSGTTIITASAAGCSGPKTATHTVTVNATVGTPVFGLGATTTRCQGAGTITYSATATSATGFTYTLDAASLTGGNSIIAGTGAVTFAAGWSGTTVITVSAAGCNGPKTASHTVTITPSVATPVFALGATSYFCQNPSSVTITYSATAANNTGLTYSIDPASAGGGNTINSATGEVIFVAGWIGTTIITATATGCNGPVSANHTISVLGDVMTPVFAMGDNSTRCQGGNTITYTATATYSTGITYTLDGASSAAGNSINAATGAVTYAAGWIGTSVITATAAGCNGPTTATHTVTSNISVGTPVFASGATSTRCQGAGTETFSATATDNAGLTYSLDPVSAGGGNVIDAVTGEITYAAGWSGNTTVTVSAAGCNGPKTATHIITITPTVGTPVFALGATSNRCIGAGSNTYTASATNNTGITYTLDPASAGGGNTIDASTGVVTYDVAWTGSSIITATATGCNGPATSSHTAVTNSLPVITATAVKSTICNGANTTITASGADTYSWSPATGLSATTGTTVTASPTTTTTYTVTGTMTAGCFNTTTITITVNPKPAISVIAGSGTICYGTSTTLTASGGTTYTWSPATGLSATTGDIVTASPTVNTTYVVTGTDGNGCTNTASVAITILAPPVITVSISLNPICSSTPTTLTASGGLSYTWSPATGLSATTGTSVVASPATSTSYIVTGNNAAGCTATATANVNVMSINDYAVNASPSTICAGSSTTITVANSDLNHNYTLRDNATNTVISGPTAGNGAPLNFSTGVLSANKTFNVLAEKMGGNGALQFDGVNDYVSIADANALDPANITVECWVKFNAYQPWSALVIKANNSSWLNGYGLGMNAAGNKFLFFVNGYPNGLVTSTTIPALNTWYHISATYSGTQTKIYINGLLEATAAYAGAMPNTTNNLYLGSGTTTAYPFNGVMDEVRIWNTTRTIAQIQNNRNNLFTGTETNLVAYYNFENGTGSSISTDIAGGDNNGTLTNMATATAWVTGKTYTQCASQLSATPTVTVTPTVGAPVFAAGATSTRCQGAGLITYNATATDNTGITYSLDAASLAGSNSINGITGEVTWAAGWSGTSTITATATGCSGPKTGTHTVTVTATVGAPIFTLGASSNRCQTAGTVTYTATATNNTGITYILDAASLTGGNTINASTGAVTYTAAWTGNSTITATATGCNGPTSSTHTVTITTAIGTPVFAIGTSSNQCQGNPIVNYSATASATTAITYTLDAASITGGNTINATTGDVAYAATWSGTTVITASAAGCGGPKTATHTVTINATVVNPVFTLGATSTRCQGANNVNYTATATNNTGISYSLDAASSTAGNSIDPITGIVTYTAAWSGTSAITVTANGCNGPKTATHTATTTATVGVPVFASGAASVRCQAAGAVTYSASATASTGMVYTLDATSTAAGNTIVAGTGIVTYVAGWSGISTITATAAGCNGPAVSTHTATTTPTVSVPIFTIGATSTRCQGANVVSYMASSANSTGISYTLDPASAGAGNSINPSTGDVTYVAGWLGNSIITATATGCNGPRVATHTATSTPSVTTPVFTAGSSSTICQGSGNVSYVATALNSTGISYSLDAASTAAGNIIRTNGLATYVNTWSGTTVVTATAAGCNGPKTAIHTVTITPFVGNPVFALGTTSTRCQGAGTVTYTATATSSLSMSYALDNTSLLAGNTINTATGAVTFTAAWTGNSTITVTATGCNGITVASHTATTTPTVGTAAFALGGTSTRCQGGVVVNYTATATNSTSISYTLDATSIANGSSINPANGAVTYASGWVGTSVVTATASGCNGPTSSTHTVTINPSVTTPFFFAGATSTRCQGAVTINYTATAANTSGLTYSLDAASLAGGNTILPGTGAVTFSASWSGTSIITVSATGCNGPKTTTHTVTITPNGRPVFAPATSTRCQGAGTITYTGSGANNSGVTYSLDAASLIGGNTINAATGMVTYLATWSGTTVITSSATGCAGVITATHTVTVTPNGTPAFAIGPVSSRLQGAGVVRYAATANNGGTVTYSLDATSLSAGNSINPSTGDVTYVATWNGTTIITASVNGCNGVATAFHTVSINSATVTKQLYLTDPAQSLDRIDPFATNDLTTATSGMLFSSTPTVILDATSTAIGITATLTVSHTTGSGYNRFMLVGVSQKSRTVTSVTYGGQALTLVGENNTNSNARVAIFQLINPPAGTANVVVNLSGSATTGAIISVSTFNNVNQTTPLGGFFTNQATSINPTANVTSAFGELVFDVVASRFNSLTVGAGQTQRSNVYSGLDMYGATSTEPGAASTTMSWTAASGDWAIGSVSIKPATFVNNTTFVQSPVLCSPLTIAANKTITITNYISNVNGSIPATPNVTALIKYNATNIITLTNPSYDNVTNLLTWTGTIGSNVTVPAGEAIALTITNLQANTGFSIEYDSKAKPSRIDLPVSTYINIDSLNVFDAPYPGGKIVVSSVAGNNSYIRAKVSDPFGAADINGVDITLTPGGTIAATLVGTSGCTRTYEYVWNTGGAIGSYNIMATAKEGYENTVTAVQSTTFSFCTSCPPVAITDTAKGAGGSAMLLNVLANDYDPNNNINPGSVSIVTQPRNGSAIMSGNKIAYLPNGSYFGKDTLTYQICDSTSPAPLCTTGQVYVTIDPTVIDPCSEAGKSQVYYIPYPEQDARTALLASQNLGLVINNLRTIISLKMPYPGMVIKWDHWEDGYETNILNPVQNTTLVWGDGNPYNGIAPGYASDIIPAGGSIVLDNTIPSNPRVQANQFYDGRDKIVSSGQITMTQVVGEPATISVQCMKTNISPTADFGTSFTIPAGENFNSQDFKYTALFIRASTNNTSVSIDKDNNNTFDTTVILNEGENLLVNGGVKGGASVASTEPVGVDVHFGGVDGYSSREVPIFPATWYSNVYYTPVPTTKVPDSAVVMLCNSLSRPLTINYTSGIPSSGTITIPAEGVVRFPLGVSATAAYKFVNLTGESFTAIEIIDSYSPDYPTTGNQGSTYDWAFNLIAEQRLTSFATVAWAPGSTDGNRNDNPIWVTPTKNTTIYVKYNGDIMNGGTAGPCGFKYDVFYNVNALNHKRILDPDRDQSGIAIYTCDGTQLAAVYGEDPSTANTGFPSWDVGSTIQPFCAQKIVLANDDQAYTMTNRPVTIDILSNDTAFLATLDPASVTFTGLKQPKNGTVSVNANGTILYTPNPGFIGIDSLEYNVCSKPAPISVVCDVALVIIKIDACPTPSNQNIISGQVFLDKNKDGLNNDDGTGFANVKVYLYGDGNCDGVTKVEELKDSVITDASGSYQFLSYPEKLVEDDFDASATTSSCNSGSDGTTSWATNWVDAGDPSSVGYCVTPAQSYANTNVEMVKDGRTGSFALRMKNPSVSATRTVNLSGATAAYLTFSYRRAGIINVGRDVLVQASTNGAAYTTIFTIAGSGVSDAAYTTVFNQNLLPYASATTAIRFATNASYGNTDTIYIDNISITYLKYPICYITKANVSTIPFNYNFTTLTQNALTANAGGTCTLPFDFGVAKTSLSISGFVYNDANGLTDGLVNGTGLSTPGGITLYAYLIDSLGKVANKSAVNAATGAYSFTNADVATTYKVMLSTLDSVLYTKEPSGVNLPSGWVSTGENFGSNNVGVSGVESGTPNTMITVKTNLTNVTGVNFGIEALPVAGSGYNSAINPGGTISMTIPASTFVNTGAGSDASPGNITSIRLVNYPANITSLTINGTIYTSANFPVNGVTIPSTSTGQPTQSILVDPRDNFVRIPFNYYTIDNAGKESRITGLGLFQVLTDYDRDGKDDMSDIDDDNDGITDFVEVCGNGATSFACLTGGSDPSADNDNDGILNYLDPDFGTLNGAGCVSILDTDGDGIPNYLDLDSDNDAIMDVVEAFGVDVDGDGVIDNYSDTDGDGLSQNVDANNTGAAGSGFGLGFRDFDGDGVANAVDLDSDNDGIPDVIEAGGSDLNNDGVADAFIDANGDGLNDNYYMATALLKSGSDLNSDGRADSYPNKNADKAGYPNAYDLDSDDDGIVDANEAGFPFYITIVNGRVTGIYVNGWATSIQSLASLNLANSDSRGAANYLDIDSDDDGISDNIEGQSTNSYIMPVDTDTDGDGLNNAYDLSPNTFGGNGITAYDHDYDGMPDYIDLDTDNDGAQDINEASKVLTITNTNIITTDADGDGMLDQFDNLNMNTLTDGTRYKNVSNSQMGPAGSWLGPTPSGSTVQLIRSNRAGDRDWRSISVLPLRLFTLHGTLKNKESKLEWDVEGEENTAFYLVERSTNGITFNYIATVSSNQLATARYYYTDDVKNIQSHKIFYRIIQVDRNGNKSISNVVALKSEVVQEVVMKAYPNPVKDRFTLSINSPIDQWVNIIIIDANGSAVIEKTLLVQKGNNTYEFQNIGNLASGVYMIKTIMSEVYVIRFVKE